MRKVLVLSMVVIVLAGLMALPAGAQDGGVLTIGEAVQGELSADVPEMRYAIEAQAGTVVTAEMTVGYEYALDPALRLLDPAGAEIAYNDDFSGLDAMIIVQIPADGTYTLIAERSEYAEEDSSGPYTLTVNIPVTLELGGSVTATVLADYAVSQATYVVVTPSETATWALTITQPGGELAASVVMQSFPDNEYVFELSESAGLRSAVLNADLEAGMMYVITIDQSLFSWAFDVESIDVTISAALAG